MISGIEALGVAAGAAQIAAYIFQLILTIDELWIQLQEAPRRIKVHSEQLSFLKSILQSVDNDGPLQNPRAQRHLGKIQDRIQSLLKILSKNISQPNGNPDEQFKTESQEKQIAKRDEHTPMQDIDDHHEASCLGDDGPRFEDQGASASQPAVNTSPNTLTNQAENNEVRGLDHKVNNGIQYRASGTALSMSNTTRGNIVTGRNTGRYKTGGNTVNNGIFTWNTTR
ncbi:hypothetical protein SLS56_011497 [Neofusicoccum ribis]|uniref:NACHT-NTPase and P-loop NTPases N-terminal domain-containing protein n=1 Tax=Neofusicoccum ribis TaxID=45134 RepID=A0ABR3SBH6_9PEZI